MNKEEVKGKVENLKGRVKDAAGSLTGNKKLQAEGLAERAKGTVQEKVGEAKRKLDLEDKDEDVTQERRDEDDDI